jgi:hypothetical protein
MSRQGAKGNFSVLLPGRLTSPAGGQRLARQPNNADCVCDLTLRVAITYSPGRLLASITSHSEAISLSLAAVTPRPF